MPDPRQDTDDAVRGFARQNFARSDSTGLPRPPRIDVSESSLDPVRFDFKLGKGSQAQARNSN